jgi:hypothetical protein
LDPVYNTVLSTRDANHGLHYPIHMLHQQAYEKELERGEEQLAIVAAAAS